MKRMDRRTPDYQKSFLKMGKSRYAVIILVDVVVRGVFCRLTGRSSSACVYCSCTAVVCITDLRVRTLTGTMPTVDCTGLEESSSLKSSSASSPAFSRSYNSLRSALLGGDRV